jgi:hypothetical protein
LHSLSDRTIHVRGDIYRALVFVFYIKWLFYLWPKYLQPFIYVRVKLSFSPNSVFFFAFNLLFLQWICFLQIISCFLSTSLSNEIDFLTTKSTGKVEFLTMKSTGEVEFLDDEVNRRSWILGDEVDMRSWILSDEVDRRSWILGDEVDRRS